MEEVGDSNCYRDLLGSAHSICIKIIIELSEGVISHESVVGLSKFVKRELMKGIVEKGKYAEVYRMVFSTAVTILKESMKNKDEFNQYTFNYALQIINSILENVKTEGAKDLCSFFWSIHNRCLIAGDCEINNVVDMEKIATFEINFVRFMLSNAANRKDLFSSKRRGEVAFMVTFFMSKFCSQKVDMPVRLCLGNALFELVKPWDESLQMIPSFLPGICCRMSELINADMNTVVIDMALKIFGCTVSTCLSDSVFHGKNETGNPTIVETKPGNSETTFKRDIPGYVEECCKNLKFLLRRISCKLVRYNDHRVRLALLNLLYDVYKDCAITLSSLTENVLIDVVLLLLNDPYEEIAAFSGKVKEYLMHRVKENFINRLRERLYSLSITIPTEVVINGDVEGCLKQLLGALFAVNPEYNNFLLGGKLPEHLTFALSSTLRLNVKRLRLSREVTEKSSVIDDLPLVCNVEKKTVSQIAVLLDCISTNVEHTKRLEEITGSYHLAVYFLRAACTQSSKPTEKFVDILQVLVEQAIALLEKIDIHHPPRDDIVEDDNDEQGSESCLVTVLLSFCAAAFICTPSVFLCQKLMNETLFEIFEWTKSSYPICAESAEYALKAATLAAGEADTSSLCVTYGKYLLPKIAIRSRISNNNFRTPCVLSSLLDHCDSPELFGITNHVVEELLLGVDLGSQEYLILILKAMLSFGMAIGKWFRDVRPQKIEYDDEDLDKKVPKPDFVVSTNSILKRTKHLLFSCHVPVRLLVLRILDICLKNLRHFPDDYLPMIHENWPAVLDCLREKNLNVRLGGFQVVVIMCELSGSFCYRRFIPEVWPAILKFMLEQSASSINSQGAYLHSAAYKFQKIVLENLGAVFCNIEARRTDWESAIKMAKAYCDVSQPEALQNASKNLLFLCETKSKDKAHETQM
uniref:Uncharacterized protein n=1 Tax=Setaria digitata TaxID=48799 RepID=A0A915PV51_9BILA